MHIQDPLHNLFCLLIRFPHLEFVVGIFVLLVILNLNCVEMNLL